MIKFKAIGAGATKILMLHDWLGDHRNYLQVERYLSEEQFTWVFPDFRGYGWSRDIAGDFSLAEAVNDIRDVAGGRHAIRHRGDAARQSGADRCQIY